MKVDAQLRAIALIALLVMIPLVLYFTTEGTWNVEKQHADGGWSGGFFMAQAEAIVHGRLEVPRESIISECWFRDGRCYGYFGITPSLVRAPFLGILRWLHSSLTPLFLSAALLLAYWAALGLLRRSLGDAAAAGQPRAVVLGYAVTGALVLGPGATLLFLARPAVYEEATAWGVAFFLLALDRVWAWHRSQNWRALIWAVVFGIAAANARPTTATACGVLGLVLIARWRLARTTPAAAGRRVLVAGIFLSLLPGLTGAGVFWLKFRTPVPDLTLNEQVPEAPHWAEILRRNGGHTAGLMFMPTELVAYFRPDAVTRRSGWPLYDFRARELITWMPPLPPGGAYVERVASLTSTMPLPWTMNVIAAVWLAVLGWRLARRSRRPSARAPALTVEEWTLFAGSVAAATAMVALTLTTVGITNRYLNDFFAISAVGVAIGGRMLMPAIVRRPVIGAAVALGVLWIAGRSILIVLSLTDRLLFH